MRLCVFLITNSIVKFCDYFFQHILCCYSTDLLRRYARDLISIHPMLLFNRNFSTRNTREERISIHPMLLFNSTIAVLKDFGF